MPNFDAKVLAIQLQQYKSPGSDQAGQLTFTPAWRTVLSVQYIFAKVQTTVFFGNQLMTPGGRWAGALDTDYVWHTALMPYFGKPMTWLQLLYVPLQNGTLMALQSPAALGSLNQQPVSQGTMTLLDAGADPQIGMWLEFAGNFWLTSTIFQGWADNPNLVHRDGPYYKGYLGGWQKNHNPAMHLDSCGCKK